MKMRDKVKLANMLAKMWFGEEAASWADKYGIRVETPGSFGSYGGFRFFGDTIQ